GDLYTSILPNLLVEGFGEAIKKSKAEIVYILNIMTKWGETNGLKASDFARILLSYLKRDKLDYIICNSAKLKGDIIKKYESERSVPVEIDVPELKKYADNILKEDVIIQSEIIRHDPKKISLLIMKLS
ncbi:MAG: 2-phospho-L-lactate transferase CofD family protein, partial [Candidatus Paceibacterota bacterium]